MGSVQPKRNPVRPSTWVSPSLRPYSFDAHRADTDTHFDGLNGLRVGWTLPIYKARDNREYYR